MAAKGDRARLEPLAQRLYAEGQSLTALEVQLGVSRQTLSQWKADSKRPAEELDDWDRARAQKRSTIRRLSDLYDRELAAAEEAEAGTIGAATWDALYKLGAMVRKWQEIERADAAAALAAQAGPQVDRPALFLETLEWIARQLRGTDPEGLKVLARNFDHLVVTFKAEAAREG